MREYKTLNALRRGEIIEIEGIRLRRLDGEFKPGDMYVAERNGPPHLLWVSFIENGAVFPTTIDYPFDLHECVKVEEVEGEKVCRVRWKTDKN